MEINVLMLITFPVVCFIAGYLVSFGRHVVEDKIRQQAYDDMKHLVQEMTNLNTEYFNALLAEKQRQVPPPIVPSIKEATMQDIIRNLNEEPEKPEPEIAAGMLE